jgi:zinc transport system substrate-binding protein
VEKLGGERVDLSVMVEPGASPHNYEPKPQQMAALSKAKIYYAVGTEFEKVWLEKFTGVNREMLIVHTERGIEKISLKADHHHEHKGKDPHVWLSPATVMVQARNILKGLLRIDPDHRSTYESNYRKFIMELVDLDAELRGIFAAKGEGMEFMVFHPAWGYFADAYGLEQVPVEIEGKEPKPAELEHLIDHAKERGIKVVFVTPQFSTKSAEMVAKAIDGQIAFVDPLAEDWGKNLREVAAKFRAALR